MERLTTEFEGFFVPKEFIEVDEYDITAECKDCWEICEKANNDCKNCAIQHCFEKLAAYENAEEAGLLFEFPCKVGDRVYLHSSFFGDLQCAEVTELHVSSFAKGISIYSPKIGIVKISINEIGKSVFLTYEEAQTMIDYYNAWKKEGE